MGQDVFDYIETGEIAQKTSVTSKNLLVDAIDNDEVYPLRVYGKEAKKIKEIQSEMDNFDKLHNDLPYLQAEVVYHVRAEKAKTVEDVLARRTRAAFLDIKASRACAEVVAKLMAGELGFDSQWQKEQVTRFKKFSENFDVKNICI